MCGIGCGIELFVEHARRLVLGAPAALFHHHPDFLGKFVLAEYQVGHSVGFQRHHLFQPRFFHLLEIRGVVGAGKRVFPTAERRDALAEFTGLQSLRTLEHHVFKNMRQTGNAILFVHRSGFVPDHVRDCRCAMVFFDDDFHSVFQIALVRGRRSRCERQRNGYANQPCRDNLKSHFSP